MTEPGNDNDRGEVAYPTLEKWVGEWLALTLERRIRHGAQAGMYWCPQWWAHPEAVRRLHASWRAWRKAWESSDADARSVWWTRHLDAHLSALTGHDGPFRLCGPDKHTTPEHPTVTPMPADHRSDMLELTETLPAPSEREPVALFDDPDDDW